MSGVLIEREERPRDLDLEGRRPREDAAETAVLGPPGKTSLGLPKTGRYEAEPPLEALEGAWPCQH